MLKRVFLSVMTCTFLWDILVVIPVAFAKGLNNLLIRTALTALLFAPAFASAATYYIAPGGSDSNPGTQSAPFLTLQKARDAVRAAISGGMMTSDLTVYLRGGTYPLTSTLTLGAADSGINGHNIIYTSYPGESAVISAGKPITGWALFDSSKNIYRANIGTGWAFRQLYVNGMHAQRARGPSNPSGWTRTSTSFTAPDSSMATWGNKTNIEIVILGDWTMNRCKVASISGTTITMQNPCWNNSQWSTQFNAVLPAWIENAYELLDTPGEWYLDTTAGYVYYIPRSGENMVTAQAVAPSLQDMISGANVSNVQFNNLTLSDSNWIDPDTAGNGYIDLQGGYHKIGTSGTLVRMHSPIYFSASLNIVFQHDLFTHLGSRALTFDNGSQGIQVLANKFAENAGGALQFGQINDDTNTNTATQNNGLTFRDNYVGLGTSFDYIEDSEIMAGYVANMVIDHNEISGSSWNPISIGWGWGTNSYATLNKITGNYIHQFSQSFIDSAAIYTLSAQGPNLASGMRVKDNFITGGGLSYGGCIYPDEGSAFETYTNNVCEHVPHHWFQLWSPTIHDITIIGNWTDTTDVLNTGGANNTVNNNTLITDGSEPTGAQTVMSQAGVSSGVTPGPIGSASAPTATLTANPASITSGGSSTLTWGSTNATSCTGTNFSTGNGISGSVTVAPTATTNYSVSCTGTAVTASASATVTVTGSGGAPFQHVVVVTFENTNYSSVIGNTSAPYFNSLANTYGLATQSYANTHPSIGNYFMLTTGQIITNDDAYSSTVSVDNIVRHLLASGKTWKEYSEGLPAVGYFGGDNINGYSQHHNPLSYFSDVRNNSAQANNLVPFTQFAPDLSNNALPNYSFVVPDLCNDVHDCPLSTGDSWLQQKIGPLINNSTLMQNTLVIVLFDEADTDNTNGGGRIYWVAVSPQVKSGYKSTTLYQHQSTLRESLEGLGLTYNLGAAATAPSMSEFFNTGTTTSTATLTANPASITSGQSSILSWSSTNTTSCTASGAWSGTKALNGSEVVTPSTTSTYTLSCTGAGGTATQSTTVTVTPPADTTAPTVSITAPTAGSTVSGSAVTVSANASDNVGVTSVDFKVDGTTLVSDTNSPYGMIRDTTTATNGSHTLTAIARDAAGNTTTSAGVTVTVSNGPPPPTLSLTANPARITTGQSSTLTWSSTNATSCTGTGFSASGTSGSVSVSPTVTTTYSVMCTGTGSSVTQSATVTVSSGSTNIALSGIAYRWHTNISATADTNKVAAPGLNDNNLTTDINLNGNTAETATFYEAGGVIWATAQTISSVNFTNGTWVSTNDGGFSANLTLQYTTDGMTWINSGWTVSPSYSYNSSTVSGVTYTLTGTPISVRGVRVSGQVRTGTSSRSYWENMREVQAFGGTTSSDTTPPSVPTSLTAAPVSSTQVNLSWSASTDNVGVTGYKLYRNGTQIATPPTTSYQDTRVSALATYSYTVSAFDAAGNTSAQSASASATTQSAPDTTPPTVSITTPANGSSFTQGTSVNVAANASDNVGVTKVDFLVDGTTLFTATPAPYTMTWNTTSASIGTHTLTAKAYDAAGNTTTSSPVGVTITSSTATSTTLEVRVNAGTDDAEEQKSTGTMYLNSSDLELTEDPEVWGSTAPTQVVGMRYNNITVPKGSTITNAYIQFTAKETTWTNSTSLVFRGQSADNAATFTSSASNVSSRPLTTAPVSWSPVVWTVANEAGTNEKTPNLSSVIQEIVNRSGWSSGNSLAVIVNGSGHRTPWSYEGKSTAAPLLHIEYTTGTPPLTPPRLLSPPI